ncbi:redoxin domain-containing protein [Halobacterium rubrum]|uniref:redoxin domain-containing protein n=1 Tax=Halobacterium TaxID=2239 RepID=UPI001F4454B8|nr:redoxin domain-containing protein [Halobacterium rubrum]MDH5020290.1 redoxin domain-containing protein [Halobacterium rubrum]
MLSEGSEAPDFQLPGTTTDPTDDAVRRHRLVDALEDGPVVLSFYLFDFHPACTDHMCSLHDLAWVDLEEDVTVFGVSTDKSFSHGAFAEREGLAFTLLSDSDGTVAETYDVLYDEFRDHKRVSKRSVFVIDTDRTVRYAWATDDPSEQPDWGPVRETLATLGGDF